MEGGGVKLGGEHRGEYEEAACRELQGAIGSLEAALVSFAGREGGIRGKVFARTTACLLNEPSAERFPWEMPAQPQLRSDRAAGPHGT